jgi:hypothetical protein
MQALSFVAESGPTSDQVPAFSWATADFASTTPHVMHPTVWQFKPIVIKWTTAKENIRSVSTSDESASDESL